jgi:hypothetical protein
MTDVNASYLKNDVRGVASFEALDQLVDSNLLAGAEPAVQGPRRILLASSTTLAQFTVVGLDSDGNLVAAVYDGVTPANTISPIGVLAHAAASGASNTTIYGEVLLTGNFNAGSNDAGADSPLVWDASWTTLALKVASVVGNPNLQFRSRRATGSPAV